MAGIQLGIICAVVSPILSGLATLNAAIKAGRSPLRSDSQMGASGRYVFVCPLPAYWFIRVRIACSDNSLIMGVAISTFTKRTTTRFDCALDQADLPFLSRSAIATCTLSRMSSSSSGYFFDKARANSRISVADLPRPTSPLMARQCLGRWLLDGF